MSPIAIESLPTKWRREVEAFLDEHPLSPAGRLRPRIGQNETMWYALLGRNLNDGTVGFGETPTTALQAFNRNFGRASEESRIAAE